MIALVHSHPLLSKLIFVGFFFCIGVTDTGMGWFSGLAAAPVTTVGVAAVPVARVGVVAVLVTRVGIAAVPVCLFSLSSP